jgi:heptosyltransferase III
VNYQRILLSRMKFIGDVVLTTPMIKAVRAAYPKAYIAYLAEKNTVSLLEHNPYLDEIIPFDFSNDSLLYSVGMMWKLFSKRFDLAIDFFSNPRSSLLTFATAAKVRVGLDVRGRGKLFTIRVKRDNTKKNAIQYYHEVLRAAGIKSDEAKTELFFTESEKVEARENLELSGLDLTRKTVVLHPGGTWPAKLWQKEKFAAVAQRLRIEGVNVVISGSGKDKDIVEYVANISGGIPFLDYPMRKLAAMISQCSVAVSNDCGIMHIAIASGTPTIGIFGPGEDIIWFPYVSPHLSFRKHVPCNPCHLNVCNRTGNEFMECMQLLTVDEVYSAIRERLLQ